MNFLSLKTTKMPNGQKINKRTCNKIDKNQNRKIKGKFAKSKFALKFVK